MLGMSCPGEKDLGVLVVRGWTGHSSVHSQPRKTNVCWAASKAVWAAGEEEILPCSDETPPAELPPALGVQHRKDMELLEQVQRRHQGDQRDGAALLGGEAERVGIVQLG
ncbi:hypothetical protein BTVI_90525 [Pitangus sulphuratus]|nr:hypothetical protein BTVI_90525 [Pitangus sulphuratus]